MTDESLWKIQVKRVDLLASESWRDLTQPGSGKPLIWTSEETAHHYAICYCAYDAGNSRVVMA